MTILTSDNMKVLLRPIVSDAADSLSFGGYVDQEAVEEWFSTATIEALQESIMYGVQRGILDALGIAKLPNMDDVPIERS